MFVVALFVASFFAGCSSKSDSKAFAITGIILDENQAPVEGVLVDAGDYGTATTNEAGEYTFSNVKNGMVIAPSKEGYHFEVKSKLITSSASNANFVASKEYNITGKIENNGCGLSGEVISFSSLANPVSNNCVVTSDETGSFVITGVAGKAVFEYYFNGGIIRETATINNPTVSLELSSSLRLAFEFDDNGEKADDISVKIGENVLNLDSDFEVQRSNLKFNDKVEILSDDYVFDTAVFSLTKQYEYKTIKAYRKYTAFGSVKSGNVFLSNADIFVDGVCASSTDINGNFEVENLSQSQTISVYCRGLDFETFVTTYSQNEIYFNGTKDIVLSTDFDYQGYETLTFSNFEASSSNKINYTVYDVHLGDVVEFSSQYYHLDNSSVTVSESDNYFVTGQVKFTATVNGLENGFTLLIDGKPADEDDLVGLYGEHIVSASYLNYCFTSSTVSASRSTATLTYKIPYSVTVVVASGDIVLSNATATVGGKTYTANNEGTITLSNLVDSVMVTVSAEGYNSVNQTLTATDSQEAKQINLTYDISGYAKTGTLPASYVTITAGTASATTNENGYFELSGLSGAVTVVATKDNYTFASNNVSSSVLVNISGTFKIFGTLENDNGKIAGRTVTLLSYSGSSGDKTTSTDENGYFEFTGLSEKYTLTSADTTSSVILQPVSYVIVSGGEYNFRSTGFSISGYVKTDEIPIVGALVKAGSAIAYTDSTGKYSFELLTSECSVSAQKEGYTFSSPILVSEDNDNLNFTATYAVSGIIKSGSQAVSGVTVLVNGSAVSELSSEDGSFVVSGLAGQNKITFAKTGLVFDSGLNISEPQTSANISCKITATVAFKTGNVDISGVDFFVNSAKQGTSEQASVTVNASFGDILSFEKTGYNFENITISFNNNYVSNATYSVFGTALSDGVILEGVLITANGASYTTDMTGKFEISGLVGEVQIVATKNGISFAPQTVTGYSTNLTLNGTFTVAGTVKVLGQTPLSGVDVYYKANKVATTDENGAFEVTGVAGYYTLSFKKNGYTIPSIENKFGSQNFNVSAGFNLTVQVKSGDEIVSNAKVDLYVEGSNIPVTSQTNSNGVVEFEGITKPATVKVSKTGYDQATSGTFNDYTVYDFDLTYSVTLVFSGVTDVIVTANGKSEQSVSSTHKITGLRGKTTITLSKNHADFGDYSEFEVSAPTTIENISCSLSYDIYGYVKSKSSNIAATGVSLKIGTKSVLTDENGYFAFTGVAGTLQIKDDGLTSYVANVDHDGDYSSSFKLTETEFAMFLVNRGYKNLDGAKSVQIYANGIVETSVGDLAGSQYIASVYKRDTKGNILKENLNNGSATAGIDPNVALLVYYDSATGTTKYNKHQDVSVSGTTNISVYYKQQTSLSTQSVSIPTASFDPANLITSSPSDIKGTFGSTPFEYSSASNTGASCSSVSFDGNYYTFKLELSTNQPSYKNQISALSPGSTFNKFTKLHHYYKIDKNGWILEINTDEEYNISQKVGITVSPDVFSDIVYKFYTTNTNIEIADIDASSASAIASSLALSAQTIADTKPASLSAFDIVTKVIYG